MIIDSFFLLRAPIYASPCVARTLSGRSSRRRSDSRCDATVRCGARQPRTHERAREGRRGNRTSHGDTFEGARPHVCRDHARDRLTEPLSPPNDLAGRDSAGARIRHSTRQDTHAHSHRQHVCLRSLVFGLTVRAGSSSLHAGHEEFARSRHREEPEAQEQQSGAGTASRETETDREQRQVLTVEWNVCSLLCSLSVREFEQRLLSGGPPAKLFRECGGSGADSRRKKFIVRIRTRRAQGRQIHRV